MKYLALILFVFSLPVAAQKTEQYDITTFQPPQGWKKETADFASSYVITNNLTGSWCRITIYKSINSSGDPKNDFNSEWNNIVVKSNHPSTNPEPTMETEDGWTAMYGASTFTFNNKEAYVILTTISGYGKEVSLSVLMNSQEYMKDIEKFFTSVNLIKPDTTTQNVVSKKETVTPVLSEVKGNHGITISTTNFDDGWVAQPFEEYTKVTKGGTTVLLHYAIQITDELRNTGNIEGTLFDQLIQPRYVVSNLRKYDNGGSCYFCIYFYEADVVEKTSGKKYYAGFRVLVDNGIARCIEIISPNQAEFAKMFPDQKNIAAMLDYNKFAVTMADLAGTWQESSGAYVNMYNTVTGAYAGMNTSSSASTFTFNNDGTYNSNHKGAYGMVGSMQFYDQKYNGKSTITNWDITLTNRFEGKTDIFWAQFEAVKGGRVLHLTDKKASGIKYHLVKIN